jgi:hypothetical protein
LTEIYVNLRFAMPVRILMTRTSRYLYYLAQIGLGMCPLSNDVLFCPLARSPIGSFFRQGERRQLRLLLPYIYILYIYGVEKFFIIASAGTLVQVG